MKLQSRNFRTLRNKCTGIMLEISTRKTWFFWSKTCLITTFYLSNYRLLHIEDTGFNHGFASILPIPLPMLAGWQTSEELCCMCVVHDCLKYSFKKGFPRTILTGEMGWSKFNTNHHGFARAIPCFLLCKLLYWSCWSLEAVCTSHN